MTAIATQMSFAGAQQFARLPHNRPTQIDCVSQRLMTGTVRTLQAGQHIFREGDSATQIYKVEQGCLSIYRLMPDGRRQIIDFAYPGDLIGLGVAEEHATSAATLTLVRLRSFPVAALFQSARNDVQLSSRLLELVSLELMAARRLLCALNRRSAGERVASFLVDLSRRLERNGGDPLRIILPMTRSDIGDLLGLTIETVSRTFSKFRRSGLIDLEQCTVVIIRDIQRLAEFADGGCD